MQSPVFRSPRHPAALALAILAMAAVFAGRLLEPDVGGSVELFFLLPIVLMGIYYGARAGLATAAVALVLCAIWALIADAHPDAVGWASRATTALLIGWLVGHFADRHADDLEVRERAKAQLRRSEARYRRFIDHTVDAFVLTDSGGAIIDVNDAACQLLGYSSDELLLRSIRDLNPEISPEWIREDSRRIAASGESVPFERVSRRKDGTQVPVEIRVGVHEDDDGERFGVAMIRDISRRIDDEAELRARAEQQAAIADLGRHAAEQVRLDVLIREAVQAAAETLDVEYAQVLELVPGRDQLVLRAAAGLPEELIGTATVAADHDTHAGFALHAEGAIVVDDLESETRFKGAPLLRDHGVRSGLCVPIKGEDGVFGALCAHTTQQRKFTDSDVHFLRSVANILETVLARERTDRLVGQLEQSRRLESVGQLAGGVAHDFNNLLAVILNYASFLEDGLEDSDIALRDDLAEIKKAARRAADLTRQLLVFSRRDNVGEREIVDVNSVIGEAENLLRSTLGEHVVLGVGLEPDLWTVRAEAGQIDQILVNLAVNARDAMSDGGALTISTKNLSVDSRHSIGSGQLEPGRYVRLTVSDSGAGMSTDVMAQAFDPFFTTKPKGEGTGLGLATVYGIVRDAGGQIQINSHLGRGTAIEIYLPAAAAEAAVTSNGAGAPALRSQLGGNGETILVIEDEGAVRKLTTRILSENGYHVLEADSGYRARVLCDHYQGSIDLLLTDVVMPGMSGKQLSEQIVTLRPNLKTLYMSGYSGDVITRQGVEEQGALLVEKPFAPEALLENVRAALGAR